MPEYKAIEHEKMSAFTEEINSLVSDGWKVISQNCGIVENQLHTVKFCYQAILVKGENEPISEFIDTRDFGDVCTLIINCKFISAIHSEICGDDDPFAKREEQKLKYKITIYLTSMPKQYRVHSWTIPITDSTNTIDNLKSRLNMRQYK